MKTKQSVSLETICKQWQESRKSYDPRVVFGINELSLTDFRDFLLSLGRFQKFSLRYEILGEEFRIENTGGHYIVFHNGIGMEYPFISRKMLYTTMLSEEQTAYLRMHFGARAPFGFWKDLQEDREAFMKWAVEIILDIDTPVKAVGLRNVDFTLLKIPRTFTTGMTLFTMANLVFPDIKVWEMRTPMHAFDNIDNVIECVKFIESSFGMEIYRLSAVEIRSIAPNILNKFSKKELSKISETIRLK